MIESVEFSQHSNTTPSSNCILNKYSLLEVTTLLPFCLLCSYFLYFAYFCLLHLECKAP